MVKEMVTVMMTQNVLVPWYVAQTTAPGVTEMTVVNSQVCTEKKLVKTQLPNIRCFSPNRLFRPIFLYRLKFQFSTAMALFRFWCFEFD